MTVNAMGDATAAATPDLDALLRRFLSDLSVTRNLSENTIRAYGTDLAAYARWTRRQGVDPLDVTHSQLRAYLGELVRARYSSRTLNRRLSAIRTLYRWLVREGYTDKDAAAAIASPKVARTLPKTMTDPDVCQLLGACDEDGVIGLRDRALIELLYASGARISEISRLDVGDIDRERRQVTLLGKGGKERIVPLYDMCIDELDAYLLTARPALVVRGEGASEALFVSTRGRRMSAAALREAFERRVRLAGLDADITPHAMRHTYATELLSGGADLRSVQELLGHSSLSTTQIYTHLSVDRLKAAARQAHPRGE